MRRRLSRRVPQERAPARSRTAGRGSSSSGASCSGVILSVSTSRPHGSSTADVGFVADAIDSARRMDIANSASWAMLHVPAARVDHDETAVGGFDYVGRMKIGIIRRDKVFVHRAKRRAVWDQCVTDDLAGVELSSKEIAAHLTGKHRALVTHEPAQRYGGIKRDGRKQLSGDWVARAGVGKVRIKSAVDQVHERVSQSALRLLKPIVGADDVATRGKCDFNEIDEPAAEHFRVRCRPAGSG